MKKLPGWFAAVLLVVSQAGCVTAPATGERESSPDREYMREVERKAQLRGTKVIWLDQPEKRGRDRDDDNDDNG